jgi:hypothetical protein
MWPLKKVAAAPPTAVVPTPEMVAEAKANPGGWVYQIAGSFGPTDRIPRNSSRARSRSMRMATSLVSFNQTRNIGTSPESRHVPPDAATTDITNMPFLRVTVDMSSIESWDSFHTVFKEALGFPDFYGRNMDAWIDCLTSLDTPEDGLTAVHAPVGGVMVLELPGARALKARCPDIFRSHRMLGLCQLSAHRSWRRPDPLLILLRLMRFAP